MTLKEISDQVKIWTNDQVTLPIASFEIVARSPARVRERRWRRVRERGAGGGEASERASWRGE